MGSDHGLFGPGSITWHIHLEPCSLVGGLRALLLQALNPVAMAAVDQHSGFRDDPWARFRRTSEYLTTTVFGTTKEAHRAAAIVRAVHKKVRGTDPVTGRTYQADDPDLLLWVHAVEVHSFLTAYRRYGGWLSDDDADAYVSEMTRAGRLLGLSDEDMPHTLADLESYLEAQPLVVTEPARAGMKLVLSPPMPLPLKPLWMLPASAAVAILPPKVRKLYGLPWVAAADPGLRVSTFALSRAMRVVAPPPPAIKRARRLLRTYQKESVTTTSSGAALS